MVVEDRLVETVLAEPAWRARRADHERRVDELTEGWRSRRTSGGSDPVDDFLFTYYRFRPGALRRWHPGATVALAGDTAEYRAQGYTAATVRGVEVTTLAPEVLAGLLPAARSVLALQRALLGRPRQHGCFGMHVWAMVYGQSQRELRHAAWPLRLPPDEVRAVVDRTGLRCTHFDAYRFFTEQAAPRNEHRLGGEDRATYEQGGCLHANMDLYKWSARLVRLVGSDLVRDSLELARDIRDLDMRAAPYDLRSLGRRPVRVETAQGRAEYVTGQRHLADRADVVRQRLVDALEVLLSRVGAGPAEEDACSTTAR